jgi:hypothetical protein
MQETPGPLPPLSERIIVVGTDRLLPHELSAAELTIILDTITSVLPEPNGDEWLENAYKYHQSTYDQIKTLGESFAGSIIPLDELREPGLDRMLKHDIHIFHRDEDISVTLHQVIDEEANANLSIWREQFQIENQRQPTGKEIEGYLYPGYQLIVHSDNEQLKAALTAKLEEQGFPVSLFLGLEKDDEPEDPTTNTADKTIFLGKKNGKFRQQFEAFQAALTPAVIKEMESEGKILPEIATHLLSDPQARRLYVYELTLIQFATALKAGMPPETPLETIKTSLKIQLMRNKV